MKRQRLSGTLRTVGMTRVAPVDPVEHIGQLRRRDTEHAIDRRRPDEAALLQPFGVERHAETVMPDDLDQIATRTSEDKEVACMGICGAPHIPIYVSGVDMWRRGQADRDSTASEGLAAT